MINKTYNQIKEDINTTGNYWEFAKVINDLNPDKRFIPSNCGYLSTERKCIKYVCDTLESLDHLSNWNLNKGNLFFENLKMSIIDFMESNGYKHYINDQDKHKFRKGI
jgi:hypothetical protein